MQLEKITPDNRAQVNAFLLEHWYTTVMVLRGREYDMTQADGFFAKQAGQIIGLVTYIIYGENADTLEILSLDSLSENQGLGTALLKKAVEQAKILGCKRVVLITTNDNIRAIQFYQKRGFELVRLYYNALEQARRLKPEIPLIGENGIPLTSELELEMILTKKDESSRRQKG